MPVSFAQEQMLVLHSLHPESPLYNVPWCTKLQGLVDVSALRRAFGWLVRRHEVLRTVYAMDPAGVPQQRVLPVSEYVHSIRVEHAAAQGHTAPIENAMSMVDEEANRGFDLLGGGPVMRVLLVCVSAEEHVLLVNTHHIATDEWSVNVMSRELGVAYAAYVEGVEPNVAELQVLPHMLLQQSLCLIDVVGMERARARRLRSWFTHPVPIA